MLTVVIPTLGNRNKELTRAIESCFQQSPMVTYILLVVNGNKFNEKLLNGFTEIDMIRVIYLKNTTCTVR